MDGQVRTSVARTGPAALAAALLAGLLTVTTAPASAAAALTEPGGCPDVRVVWAGGQARDAAVRELRRVPGQRVSVTAVAAPAPMLSLADLDDIRRQGLRHPHFEGWRGHARRALRTLDRSAETCPWTMLVLGGHSEGAVAAREAARRLSGSRHAAARRHLGALWLLGDPLEKQREVQGQQVLEGVLAGRGPEVPRWVRRAGMLASSCVGNDPVCGGVRGQVPTAEDLTDHDAYDPTSLVGQAGRMVIAEKATWPAISGRQVRVPLSPRGVRGVRAEAVRTLPRGLRISRGHLVGRAPHGRTAVRLRVWSKAVAPAVRRPVTVVLDARRQAAERGTVLVSRGVDARPANAPAWSAAVSDDARAVVYLSTATNLVRGDRSAERRVRPRAYAWDATTGRTELVSVDAGGSPVGASDVRVSGTGRFVLFRDPDTGITWLRDRVAGTSQAVPVAAPQDVVRPASLGRDGRTVTFADGGATRRWHADTGVVEDLGVTGFRAASPDGRFLALVDGATLRIWDTVLRTAVASGDFPASPDYCRSEVSSVSDDGRYVVEDRYCDRYRESRPLEVSGMRPLDQWSPQVSLAADASGWAWVGRDRTVRLQPVGGTDRRLLRAPRWLPTHVDADVDRFVDGDELASVSAAPGGRGVAFGAVGYDVVPGAYTDVEQVYLWTAG
ncbi:cutinase family protein [Nocardioides cavernae]|nr:cutinase family protein [Nocardioides cavernae]